ncbi:MAG TPA: hypothetical protein VMQ11_16775 [Alphaproteobacteria bacterium]|nr:hypothetical protein [Alphaproteobacteria bacterium]
MRKAASTGCHPPLMGGLGITIASAAVAYVLFVLTSAMTVERLIDSAPPEIAAGIAQAAAAGWLAP